MDDSPPSAPRAVPPGHLRAERAPAPGMLAGPEASSEDERALWPAMRRGLLLRCPHCGEGRIFEGYLKVADHCPACGIEMHHHRADDGPAYLTILLVGHLVGFAMHFAWVQWRPEPLLFATVLTVLAVALSLFLLPRIKGAIVGLQWARRMHGFST